VSRDPCNDAYLGPTPFSEIEVETVAHYIRDAGNFDGYIDFHAFGQLWMTPWGYTNALPPDYNQLYQVAGRSVNALYEIHGTQYEYGSIANIIYLASGSSADYTHAVAGVKYSYGVELRDLGTYGFLLPANQIVPSGEETYQAVKAWAISVLEDNQKIE